MLATYEVNNAANASSGTLNLSEHHFYGSSRLGIVRRSQNMDEDKLTAVEEDNLGDTYLLNFTRGNKLFEVTNHLGNVVMVLADLRTGIANTGNPSLVSAYNSVMVYASDYTPFGRPMAGRVYNNPWNYRYGFNGKENDNEVQAAGNLLDYGNRMYDPMVGRFWSVDPLTRSYPWYSPYHYAGNSPIANVDIDGREDLWFMSKIAIGFARAKLGLYSAGDNFRKKISDYNAASNNNYGNFDQSGKSATIQEQVNANAQKAFTSRVGIYADFTKGTSISMGLAASPFVSVASAAALPELFVVSGSSQLSTLGSYLVKTTIESSIDVAAQKLVNGKVDWADIASNYLPVKGKMGKILLEAFQSSVDYDKEKGIQVVGFNKGVDEAAIDAFALISVSKLFGKFDKELEGMLKSKGFTKDKLATVMGAILKTQTDFIKKSIKTGLSEGLKNSIDNDKSNNK